MQLVKERGPDVADALGQSGRAAGAQSQREEQRRLQQPQRKTGVAWVQQNGAEVQGETEEAEAGLQENQEQQSLGRWEEYMV